MFDWMHIFCVYGIFNRQLDATLTAIKNDLGKNAVVNMEVLHDYMKKWIWPKQQGSGANVFETGGFQANASATLSCCPVLAHFFREVLLSAGLSKDAVLTFLMCANVIELLDSANT